MFERTQPVICAGARTPIGRFGGTLASLPAVELGGQAIGAALQRAGVAGDAVEHVVMGHVLQAGQGQITARQAAVRAGIPMTVPALTVNKVCLSGLNAIATAAQYVELGQAALLVAGGMESMSGAPFLLPKARFGARMGDAELVDSMIGDGLWDAFDDAHMGGLSDQVNQRLGIDRATQDEWSARSHERAAEAAKNGALGEEISPVVVLQRKGEPYSVDQDEGIRPGTTAESLARLRPAFSPEGTITAGNASQLSDGAAAVVVTSRERAAADGLPVLASIIAYGTVAGPDTSLHSQPSRAIADACRRAGVAVGDLDLVEINEAFAAVALRSTRELELDEGIVNVNGGAVALGHPIGASGARVVLTLAMELRRRGGGLGAAALCGGGGQGDALLVRVEA
ncbi:MAG TPA: acetyl-CoA C-acetyltransferase [Actinomycetes bacterium]|nr:acetyl-CoA C-acetyltransferase [Actinomycetes bacterium]